MRKIAIPVMLLALLLCCLPALGEHVIYWPDAVTVVDDEVFLGDWSLDRVVLPDSVTSIGSRAFADSTLGRINLPADCAIASDAFNACQRVTVDTVSGSAAASFATKNIDLAVRTYEAGTYAIGTDLPANVYIIRAQNGKTASVTLTNGGTQVLSKSFTGNIILQVKDGETLKLTACTAIVDYEFDHGMKLSTGSGQAMLRVGVDIPAGGYSLLLTGSGNGTVTWYSDYRMTVSNTQEIDSYFALTKEEVTFKDGDLIGFDGVRLPGADGVTTYRAVLIGNTYTGTDYELSAPLLDARAMASMLQNMSATPYSTRVYHELTMTGICDAISEVFAAADDDDVSLFYYSGHGSQGGNLISADFYNLSPYNLRAVLDLVPGTKIIIIDACYSGAMIGPSAASNAMTLGLDDETDATEPVDPNAQAATAEDAAAFVSSFNSAFAPMFLSRTPGYFDESPYYIITACAPDETSWERSYYDSGKGTWLYAGLFTNTLTGGCGWNQLSGKRIDTLRADANGDGSITLAEVYSYTKPIVLSAGTPEKQTVSCYPSGSDFVFFGR